MSVQRFQSLPKKTQPTLHSSFKQSNTAVHKFPQKANPQCPETSQFKLAKQYEQGRSREKIYIHNLHIDYGRLQKPNHYYFDGGKYSKAMKMREADQQEQQLPEHMQTKRVVGISSLLDQSQIQEKNTQKKKIQGLKVQADNHKTDQTSLSTIQNLFAGGSSISKPKIRLQEVKAYDQGQKNNESNRKRLHSRIVKMVVAGGGKKTRIICYPDTSDYQRLCSHK